MNFYMRVNMDNAAFADNANAELAGMLAEVGKRAMDGQTFATLNDTNGNKCGHFMISEADDTRDEALSVLKALLMWGREHTSPRDENSPHALLIAAAAVLKRVEG